MNRHGWDAVIIPSLLMTRDHVQPFSYGGRNALNLVAACSQCNLVRGNAEATIFARLMQKWFLADQTLQRRWHQLSREEVSFYRREVLRYHERYLRYKAVRCVEHAFRHFHLILYHGHELRA